MKSGVRRVTSDFNPPAMRLLSLLAFVSFSAFGQTDSLLNVLEHASHDTLKLQTLDVIIEANSSDYALLEKYSLQMQELSKAGIESSSGKLKKLYSHYYATALNNLAFVEENKPNMPGAIGMYKQSLDIFHDTNDKEGEAMVLTNLGYVSKKSGDLSSAIQYYNDAVKINKEIDNKLGTYASVNNLGLAYFTLGDIQKALTCYFEGLKIAEGLNDKRRQARMYNNIAGIYEGQKEKGRHLEYLEKGLKMAIEGGEKRGEAAILNNLVVAYVNSKEYDKAQKDVERVIQIANELSDKGLLSNGLSALANVNRTTGNFSEALNNENQALAIRRGMGNKVDISASTNFMGETYIKLNDYKQAIAYFNESLNISKEINYTKGVGRAAKNLSASYKQQGNNAKALEFYELYVTMRDSITNEENRKATFKSQYKYEYEIKATADSIRTADERTVLNAQLSQEKSQRYALVALIILGATLAFFIFYRFRVQQQMKELQLRNRIASDLHDEVGSAISSISLFAGIAKMKSSENDEIMAKIENTSRETVDKMGDIVWSIEPSNDRFDNVLKKMNYFGDQLMGELGIKFNFAVENGLEKTTFDMATRKNIYLIYKEAINNAAKYSGAKNVNVALSKEGSQYEMEIADDGRGFDMSSSTLGNGLRNMKRRAEELDGKLIINSSEKGTVITLTV